MRSTPYRRGFAMGGVLAIGAFIAVAAGTAIMWAGNSMRASKYDRIGRARDRIAERLSYAARQPANLNQSAAMGSATNVNTSFTACALNGNGPCNNVAAWTEFDLYDAGGVRIAGPQVDPIRYDLEEKTCAGPASAVCPFEAIAMFRAFCDGAPPCDSAGTLEVQTRVRMAPGVVIPLPGDNGARGVRVSDRLNMSETQRQNPADPNMSETQRVAGREVAGRGWKGCNPPEVFKGTDKNGRVVCEAPPGVTNCQPNAGAVNSFVANVDFGNKTAQCAQLALPNMCAQDQYFRGFDNGGNAVCEPIMPIVDERIELNYQNYKQFARCPAGLVAVGAQANGAPICEKLPIATGQLPGLFSPPPSPALNPPIWGLRVIGPLPFVPRNATCSTNLKEQAWDVPWTLCICEMTAIDTIGKTVTFKLTLGAGGGALNGHACGASYVIWGNPNEGGP